MGQWVFEELRGAAVRRGPQEALLFKTEQAGEGEYAGNDHLVREVLQNAIDARHDHAPVRVRFAIHEADEAPSRSRLSHYFARLQPALEGRPGFAGDVSRTPCRFLVCEDFGTRGLEGDPRLFSNPPYKEPPEDFYWFWRNIGLSGKTGLDLGRWGLGKTVFRAVSQAGCMFGLTIRASDRRRLLMGQAVLQIHRQKAEEYQPEGYWCGAQSEQGLPLPIDDRDELQQFSREWKLARKDEAGTSIVSPFIPQQLSAKRLVQAVAVHFFTRILRGEMVVEVVGRDVDVAISRDTIEKTCTEVEWEGPKRSKRHAPPPIAFARACLARTQLDTTQILGQRRIPAAIDESALEGKTLEVLRRDFAAGFAVSVRVRLHLPRRTGDGAVGYLDLHAQRAHEGEKCDAYFVREGMTITKIGSRASSRGVRALVIVDQGALATLLGDTEGPAHEDWDTSEERPDRTWQTWKGRVAFVRRIVDHFVDLLTPETGQPDYDLLSDFFSIDRTRGQQRTTSTGALIEVERPPPFVAPPADPKWYQISGRAGGFTVSRNTAAPMPEDSALIVRVAYDLTKGDPLKAWSLLDFRIGNVSGALKPTGHGAYCKPIAGNIFVLSNLAESFQMSVDGFDRHRDVYVRVDEIVNFLEANS